MNICMWKFTKVYPWDQYLWGQQGPWSKPDCSVGGQPFTSTHNWAKQTVSWRNSTFVLRAGSEERSLGRHSQKLREALAMPCRGAQQQPQDGMSWGSHPFPCPLLTLCLSGTLQSPKALSHEFRWLWMPQLSQFWEIHVSSSLVASFVTVAQHSLRAIHTAMKQLASLSWPRSGKNPSFYC